jgi:predicted dehydrogenase
VRLAEKRNVSLTVGFNRRYAPGYAQCADHPRDLIVMQKHRVGLPERPRKMIFNHTGQRTLRRRGDWVPVARQRGIEQVALAFLDAVRADKVLGAQDALATHELCERVVSAIQERPAAP